MNEQAVPGPATVRPPKPLPVPCAEDAEFWARAKQHELVLPRCRACSHVWFPPYEWCQRCLSREREWIAVSGRGEVFGVTVIEQPYLAAFVDDLPYNVVIVQLEDGPMLYSNMVGVPNDEITVGMAVEVVFDDVSEEISLPRFRPRRWPVGVTGPAASGSSGRSPIAMSAEYEAMQQQILGDPGADVGVGGSAEAIAALEARFGALPADYRRFLVDFGWLSVRQWEIVGIGPGVPTHLEVGALTASEREDYGLPDRYVVIMNNGSGDLYCLDLGAAPSSHTCPVIVWLHEEQAPEFVASSFVGFMLDVVLDPPQ